VIEVGGEQNATSWHNWGLLELTWVSLQVIVLLLRLLEELEPILEGIYLDTVDQHAKY
jgi:hypothetical protein